MEVYYLLPTWNSLRDTMKKWHLPVLVCCCVPEYLTPQSVSSYPADDRMPSAPILSTSTQLYLTGGHTKMVCQMPFQLPYVLIHHIDNAYGMESSVSEYTRDWVRVRQSIEPTKLT